MSVSSIGSKSAISVQKIVDMSAQLDDLRRQLGTGKRAETYAGIGLDRGLTVGLRSQLNAITSFDQSITSIGTRLQIAQTSLTRLDDATHTVKAAALSSAYVINQGGLTTDQFTAYNELDQMLALLNTQVGDQYIFSGKSADRPAVETLDHIIKGSGTRLGLVDVTAERLKADLGANGLGRLLIPAASTSAARITGTGATLTPDTPAFAAGSTDISSLVSAAGTLVINGQTVNIAAGTTATGIRDAINNDPALPGVNAALGDTGQLVITATDAETPLVIGAGSTLLGALGMTAGTSNPTNLVSQGFVNPQTLTLTVGASTLSVTFGTGAGEVTTMAELNAALAGFAGGTASVDPVNGNLSVVANNTTDSVIVGGTATIANFGVAVGVANPIPGTRVSITQDAPISAFGFKLTSVSSDLTGAFASGPSGTPAGITVDLTAVPVAGEKISVVFSLPDGTSETLTLVASTRSPPNEGEFTIGIDAAATAANLQSAIVDEVGTLARTSLTAASAITAADSFFTDNPPMRVDGTSPEIATGLVAGTAANTMFWYTGEDDGTSARNTATGRIDRAMTVSFGMRANEQGISSAISTIAAFATMQFSSADADGQERYAALTQRVSINIEGEQGDQTIMNIEAEIAGAQATMVSTKDRHQQTAGALTDLLQTIEVAPIEEVAAQILTLQTRLQASLQTTALLAKTSLVNFL
jgi:hypothetical protein